MLEDAICVSQWYSGGIDVEQLRAELEGLRVFAQDDSYAERPGDEAAAAAFADAQKVFGGDMGVKNHLSTTIMHHHRRLGLWKEAIAYWLAEERAYLRAGYPPDSAISWAWRALASSLCVASSIDNLFEMLVGQAMRLGLEMGIQASCVRFVRTRGPDPTNDDESEDPDIDEDDRELDDD
jgi:hypothetical protein